LAVITDFVLIIKDLQCNAPLWYCNQMGES